MKKKKTAAAFLSTVMFCTALPAFPAVHAADTALPAWVPQNFEKALEFQNTYGKTHAADGVYCIVERMKNDLNPQCAEQLSIGAAERIFQTEIRYEVQDGMPDLESMSAKERAEWEANAEQRRMEEQYNADVQYFVSVWKPTQAGDNEIVRQYQFNPGGQRDATLPMPETFTFTAADDTLAVAETGWRAVTPDCKTEYAAFIEEHGNFYTEDGGLVLAGTVNYSTGADMSMEVEWNGEKMAAEHTANCRAQGMTEAPPGSAEDYVKYYEIARTGVISAKITWTEADPDHTQTTVSKKYQADTTANNRIFLTELTNTEVPDWAPQTVGAACDFHNNHGDTYVADDTICIVTRHWSKDMERLPLAGSGNCRTLLDAWYETDGPISYNQPQAYYHVTVYKPEEAKTVAFYDYDTKKDKKEAEYVFAVDEDLHVTETDWRGFVPDCGSEARLFKIAPGQFGLGDNYMNACNVDGIGSYVVFAAQDFAGISSERVEFRLEKDGEETALTWVNCALHITHPASVDGAEEIAYAKITEPGTYTAILANKRQNFEKQITLNAVKNTDGTITVLRENEEAVPAWVPVGAEACADFCEAYGDFRAEKGLLCLCLPYEEQGDDYHVLDDPSPIGDFAEHKVIWSRQYVEGEPNGVRKGYRVVVIKVTTEGNVGMKWVKVTQDGDIRNLECEKVLFFTADKDLNIKNGHTAEDDFSFLPQSFADAKALYEKNGAISVQNGYIVCCGQTNLSTGYDILTETAGDAGAEIVKKAAFSFEPDDGATGGNRTYQFYVLKPKQKGQLKVKAIHARKWDLSDGSTVLDTKYYTVGEDLSLKEFKVKAGDLSNDGKQDAADAVVLSKYLSGTGTLDGNLFFAADLNNDNRINAADLTCMKRQLIYAKNA